VGPRAIAWGDQGGGALWHQIGQIGVVAGKQNRVAGETIDGVRAPPPFPVFLEKDNRWVGLNSPRPGVGESNGANG